MYDPDRPWPFLAREPEFDVLTAAIARGIERPGMPSGAVIVAPAGIGKTRLAREAIGWARDRGIPTLQIVGTRAAMQTPYAAVAPLLTLDDDRVGHDAASHYRAVAAVLPAGARPVFLVDDAPLLDDGSATVVLQLALAGRITPLVTARRGVPVPDAVTVLWKDGLATRLDLQPFSPQEIIGLVSAGLRGPLSTATGHRLAATVAGNPLYARELVRTAVAAGALTEVGGLWTWDGTVVVGDRLVDAVGRRLRGLSATDRADLVRLAVGEPLSIALAERVIGVDTLVRLESSGLVHVDDGRYRLEHPLFSDVLLARAGAAATRAARRELADAADELSPGRDVLRRVTWRMDGGGRPQPGQLLEAARMALDVYDAARAARFATAVLDRGEGDDGAALDPVERADARVLLAAACNQQRRFAEAERQIDLAEHTVLTSGSGALRREWMDAAVVAMHQGLGHADDAEALLRRVEASASTSAQDKRLARALRANLLFDAGRASDTAALAGDVLAKGQRDYAAALAAMSLAEAQVGMGLTSRARRSFALMRRIGDSGVPRAGRVGDYAVVLEMMSRIMEGHVDNAAAEMQQLYAALTRQHEHTMVGVAAMILANAQLRQGRLDAASRTVYEAVDCLSRTDVEGLLAWVYSLLAQITALRGDAEGARAAQHRARELHHTPVPLRARFDLIMADVDIRIAEGDITGASRIALAAAGDRSADGLGELVPARARMLYTALRLTGVDRAGIVRRLRDMSRRCEGEFVGMLADSASALVSGDGAALARLSEVFEERGLRIEARDAAADAAQAYSATGQAAKAVRMRGRADRLNRESRLPSWRAAATAHEQDGASPLSGLSRREREVVLLAAQGLSNAQIAARLVLSVRTVESHLYQAYGKLGVTGRDGLTAVVG